jgi:hypothetical protein
VKTCVEHGSDWANHCMACEASRFAHARDVAWKTLREHAADRSAHHSETHVLARELLMLEQTVRFLWTAWAEREGDGQPHDAVFGPGVDMLHHLASAGEAIPKFAPLNVQAIVREALASNPEGPRSVRCQACGDIRSASCGADDCAVPWQLEFSEGAAFVVPENTDPSDVVVIGPDGELRFPRIPIERKKPD